MNDETTGYWADDGNAPVFYAHARTGREAAETYVAEGDWDTPGFLKIHTWREGVDGGRYDEDRHTIELPSTVVPCIDGHEHAWIAPVEVVGGIVDNPGVYGNGGGVVITRICRHCGAYQRTDTWAQDPETGEQGLTAVTYSPADARSKEWIERN